MIFFDIDDTLLNDRHAQDGGARGLWREFGHMLPYGAAEFPALWDAVTAKHYRSFTSGEVTFTEQRRRRIREVFRQPDLADEVADARFARYLAHIEANWTLFDDAVPCLKSLAGYRLGVITNGDPLIQRRKLSKMGLTSFFSVVLVPGDIGIPKPQAEIVLHACRLAGVQPEKSVMIGDNLVFDVRGSSAVGMTGIWLNRRAEPAVGLDLPIIETLAALPPLLPALDLG